MAGSPYLFGVSNSLVSATRTKAGWPGGPMLREFCLTTCLGVASAFAWAASPGDALLGEWHGTSVCIHQEPGSPCKDETIRYVVTANPRGPARYHMDAQKLVAGAFESMGEFDLTWSVEDGRWTYRFDAPRCPGCTWWYRLDDESLRGGITDAQGVELREVHATR